MRAARAVASCMRRAASLLAAVDGSAPVAAAGTLTGASLCLYSYTCVSAICIHVCQLFVYMCVSYSYTCVSAICIHVCHRCVFLVLMHGYTGLFHRYTGRLCENSGLFHGFTGLFRTYTGLFYGHTGLFCGNAGLFGVCRELFCRDSWRHTRRGRGRG